MLRSRRRIVYRAYRQQKAVACFSADAARGPVAATLSRYHSADSSREGRISLAELTRVIQLYNHRNGTVRTGQYHAQSDPPTEDGFAPGP